MSTILNIDGLGTSVEQALNSLFSRFGHVLSVHMSLRGRTTKPDMGRVEMERVEDAQKAVSALHRSYLDGFLVLVFSRLSGDRTHAASHAGPCRHVILSSILALEPSSRQRGPEGLCPAGYETTWSPCAR